MNRSEAVLTANRPVGNIQSATVALYVAYLDRRSAYAAGIHSPTLAALHAGRSLLWDRQAMVLAGGDK